MDKYGGVRVDGGRRKEEKDIWMRMDGYMHACMDCVAA
jgi:hypothetical protein